MNAIVWLIAVVIVLAILVALFAWFYERATNEVSSLGELGKLRLRLVV